MMTPSKLQEILKIEDDVSFLEGVSQSNKLMRFYFSKGQLIIDEKYSNRQSYDYFNMNLINNNQNINFFHKNTINETFYALTYAFGHSLNFIKK